MPRFMRRLTATATLVGCLGLALGSALLPSSASADACSTANPASDFSSANLTWNGDQDIVNNFTAARAAEGCNTPLVLPAGYDAMTPHQQVFALMNLEREARGEPDLQLDQNVIGQVAQNHSLEMATYGFLSHTSPINQLGVGTPGVGVPRQNINPVFSATAPPFPNFPTVYYWFFGEDAAQGFSTAASTVFAWMYQDTASGWGHRGAILQAAFNWSGVGYAVAADGTAYWTADFELYNGFVPQGAAAPTYTPPPTADTNPPTLGPITYANGTATVTGVADSPLNVNDTGANPVTAGVTGVVFYTNSIVASGPFGENTFNTVAATQTAPGSGTWTAQITVNPGDVLHAVAVDGSGNFADVSMPPPATTLTPGANTVAVPAATTTTTMARLASAGGAQVPAATPSAKALAHSIDSRAHGPVVTYVKVYVDGHWRTYVPGKGHNFAIYTGEGVVVGVTKRTRWRAPAGDEPLRAPTIHLHRGWNFVAAPYPIHGMTCHATRLELAHLGDKLLQITVGPSPDHGVIMRPHNGKWGNDLMAVINDNEGFWVKDTGSATWIPNPTQYVAPAAGTA